MRTIVDDANAALLGRFAANGDQSAFTTVVRSYTDLVYSVALRQVGGDGPLAEEVVQQTFALLARKARDVSRYSTPAGWLYRAAVFSARAAARRDRSRRRWERAAGEQAAIMSEPARVNDPAWEEARPELDRALGALPSGERDAVLLRFYENRRFPEIGRALGISEDAARMRVERALARLGRHLGGRREAPSAAAVGALVAGSGAVAAPPALAGAAAIFALSGVGTAAPAAAWLVLMSSTKALVGLSLGVILAAASAWYETHQAKILGHEIAILSQANARLDGPGKPKPQAGTLASPPTPPAGKGRDRGWSPMYDQLEDPDFRERFIDNQLAQFELNVLPAFAYFRVSDADRKRVLDLQEKRQRYLIDVNLAARALGLPADDPALRWMVLQSNLELFATLESISGLKVYSVGRKMERLRAVGDVAAVLAASDAPLTLDQGSALADLILKTDGPFDEAAIQRLTQSEDGDAAKILSATQRPAYDAFLASAAFNAAARRVQRARR